MTEEPTFNKYLNFTLQVTEGNSLPLGGFSITVSVDFLQMASALDRAVFQPPKNIGDNFLVGNLWAQLFKICKLTEIVRQSSGPEFAQILNRIREIVIQMMLEK